MPLSTRRPSLPRIVLLAISFFAFVLQSYVTETHIHGDDAVQVRALGPHIKVATRDASTRLAGSDRKDRPSKNDPVSCPFCQAMLQAGAFLTPASLTVSLPQQGLSVEQFVSATVLVVKVVSHNWRGRGPPAL
jgi:hypothetical protein